MDNAKQHWKILQELGTDLENKVREFMVIGKEGDGVIVATEDGLGYWLGKMQFGEISKQAMKPTLLDVSNLSSMAQGSNFILLLTKSGQIYAMGKNDQGQLGLGTVDYESHFTPQLIFSLHKFISVRCGGRHSLALAKDGKVWAWGENVFGQVPKLNAICLPSPHKISKLNPHRVVAIECGDCYSLALTDLGEVYGWGFNGCGQLGHEIMKSMHTPTRMLIHSPVQSMAAGFNHTLLLTQTREVYSCGRNVNGQLGLPTTIRSSPSLSKVVDLPPILQIASHPLTNLSIAMSPDHRCFVWGGMANETSISTPRKLSPLYSTVDSPLSSFSTYRNTPYSVTLSARECSHRTDSTTQTDTCFDTVLSADQTMPSPNPILERMFNNPDSSSDVRFQVGDQTILAHRSVLQTTSGHFHRLFSSHIADLNLTSSVSSTSQTGLKLTRHTTNPSDSDTNSTTLQWSQVTISIPDHSYPAFHAYLRYLYLGILKVASEHLADLFSLSVAYLESNLQQLCLSRMRTTLSPATCCLYYPLTYQHSLPELSAFQQELVQFISTQTSEVYRTAAYQSMDAELCKKLSISMANLDNC